MGLFGKLFAKQEDTFSDTEWIPLTDLGQLNEIVLKSSSKTQAIFKHSTRCGISRMVIKQFEEKFDETDTDVDLYFLDLLRFREISNAIAVKFNVVHQSPQLIVIKDKKVIAHDSHHGLVSIDLK